MSSVQIGSCLPAAHFVLEAGNSTMSKAGAENVPESLNSIPGSFSVHYCDAIFLLPVKVQVLHFNRCTPIIRKTTKNLSN